MVASENRIIQTLTGKDNLGEVSVAELQDIVKHYPAMPAAHLLLTRKLMQLQDVGATQQKQKTAVYFPDVFWLDHLLNNLTSAETIAVEAPLTVSDFSVAEEPAVAKTSEEYAEVIDEPGETASSPAETVIIPEEESITIITEEEPAAEAIQVGEADVQEEIPTSVDEVIGEVKNDEQADITTNVPGEEFTVDRNSFAEHLMAEEDQLQNEEEIDEVEDTTTDFNPLLSKVLAEQAQEFNKPVQEDAKLPIESEPYYTIDYFDSQGIRLDPSQLNKDKLGRKVRKFTDWLKDMKRTPGQPSDLGTDPEMEKAIQTIAASSNETKEIVTEAMAEVLIKEGKQNKAIKLYEKLSFLNPDKSAYFAAKIDQIKGLS